MTEKRLGTVNEVLVEADGKSEPDRCVLRLYVAGATPRSQGAIRTVKGMCEKHLAGRYDLEVIDVYQQPELAGDEQVVAAPTLVKVLPPPARRIIGDMADEERMLVRLDLQSRKEKARK